MTLSSDPNRSTHSICTAIFHLLSPFDDYTHVDFKWGWQRYLLKVMQSKRDGIEKDHSFLFIYFCLQASNE